MTKCLGCMALMTFSPLRTSLLVSCSLHEHCSSLSPRVPPQRCILLQPTAERLGPCKLQQVKGAPSHTSVLFPAA